MKFRPGVGRERMAAHKTGFPHDNNFDAEARFGFR
jgi:hypothetical protein